MTKPNLIEHKSHNEAVVSLLKSISLGLAFIFVLLGLLRGEWLTALLGVLLAVIFRIWAYEISSIAEDLED